MVMHEALILPTVGVLARSVLLKGALTDRYQHLPDALLPLKQCVESLRECSRYDVETLPELAYRYALSEATVIVYWQVRPRYTNSNPLSDGPREVRSHRSWLPPSSISRYPKTRC